MVLLSGEAGVGKTSLIKHFTNNLNDENEILWGACDALFTPRPLGPLHDIAYQLKSDLLKMLENEEKRVSIFSAFLDYLVRTSYLKVIVIEDIHWADESTLDFIKFLSRRISKTKSMLILTYRDDEIDYNHPLHSFLGDLPHDQMTRIRLYPLSEAAVSALMQIAGVKNDKLYKRTGGNPFYVTEVLASKNEELPLSIKEAVIARTSKLPTKTRDLLNIISVIPSKIELELLRSLFSGVEDHIDQCISQALLVTDKKTISFRHELARLAILNSIPEMKKMQLHQKVLNILLESDSKLSLLARIVHHASHAKDKNAIIKYAPLAARQASMLDSHREAAANYLTAIEYSDKLSTEKILELYEGRYSECLLTGQISEAIKACEAKQKILEQLSEPLQLGLNYAKLAGLMRLSGGYANSNEYSEKAIKILEMLPASVELAMAYSTRSSIFASSAKPDLAIELAEKAIRLAKKFSESEIEIHALTNIGLAKMYTYDDSGESVLKKSLTKALQKGFDGEASRIYINLGLTQMAIKNYPKAHQYFNEGISHCIEKDMDMHRLNMIGSQAKVSLDYGNWDDAVEKAEFVIKQKYASFCHTIVPYSVIGLIRARRNDPHALEKFDEAICSSLQRGECSSNAIVAKAEAYWIADKFDQVMEEMEISYQIILESNHPWKIGELAFWLWKGGRLNKIPGTIAKPYYLHITGDWPGAATVWRKLKFPYHEALALADGDEEKKRKALTILESLGAIGTINLLKRQMREAGIKKIPMGPRKSTKANPAGLTGRQLDVLKLLTDRLSNAEIADKLFISPKTVDHHISAILLKLDVSSRTEAALYAHESGIIK